jgi:hypothetical protein
MSVCCSAFLFLCLSVFVSFRFHIILSFCSSVSVVLSVCHFVFISFCLSIFLFFCLCDILFSYHSVCLSFPLFVFLLFSLCVILFSYHSISLFICFSLSYSLYLSNWKSNVNWDFKSNIIINNSSNEIYSNVRTTFVLIYICSNRPLIDCFSFLFQVLINCQNKTSKIKRQT